MSAFHPKQTFAPNDQSPQSSPFGRAYFQPTGEIGPGGGFVPGDGGVGTSMSGPCGGVSGGGWLGCPGWLGWAGVLGGVSGGFCCILVSAPDNERLLAGLPAQTSLLYAALGALRGSPAARPGRRGLLLHRRSPTIPTNAASAGCPTRFACYTPPPLGPRARGGTGRRAGFRFQYRKMWGFESLRAHQPPGGPTKDFIGIVRSDHQNRRD